MLIKSSVTLHYPMKNELERTDWYMVRLWTNLRKLGS